jgi:hypothetical protein
VDSAALVAFIGSRWEAVMQNTHDLPPVELWWPRLDIPAKQWLATHLNEPIPARILAEICALCDRDDIPDDAALTLSVTDQGYIETQTEPVD